MIGTPEEAAERRRQQTAERVRRFRERHRVEKQSFPPNEPAAVESATQTVGESMSYDTAGKYLRRLVEHIEHLEKDLSGLRTRNPALADAYTTERRYVQEELRKIWNEAKKLGFDAEALHEIIRLRKFPLPQRTKLEHTVNIYKKMLGM